MRGAGFFQALFQSGFPQIQRVLSRKAQQLGNQIIVESHREVAEQLEVCRAQIREVIFQMNQHIVELPVDVFHQGSHAVVSSTYPTEEKTGLDHPLVVGELPGLCHLPEVQEFANVFVLFSVELNPVFPLQILPHAELPFVIADQLVETVVPPTQVLLPFWGVLFWVLHGYVSEKGTGSSL